MLHQCHTSEMFNVTQMSFKLCKYVTNLKALVKIHFLKQTESWTNAPKSASMFICNVVKVEAILGIAYTAITE